MSSFSGWGPTDDGRIKPDICANGVGLYSSYSGSDTQYASISGTSMATPNLSGSLLLLQQHYQNLFGTGSFMRSATLKGLVIHTADEAGSNPGPDYKFGWGLANMATAAQAITAAKANNGSFVFVLAGAVFFIISDALIAINKFYAPFELASFLIMITYIKAQYLILVGLIKHTTQTN